MPSAATRARRCSSCRRRSAARRKRRITSSSSTTTSACWSTPSRRAAPRQPSRGDVETSMLEFLAAPFVASLILTGIHSYLGVHVVERGVIFVDLSLAQIAALGATIAIFLPAAHGDPHAPIVYWISLAFTFIGA